MTIRVNSYKSVKLLTYLSRAKCIKGNIVAFVFQDIDTNALQKEGYEERISFKNAEYYIEAFLKKMNQYEKFRIKDLTIKGNSRKGHSDCVSIEAFKVILDYVVKPRLNKVLLFDLDLVTKDRIRSEDGNEEENISKGEIMNHYFSRKPEGKKNKISLQDLRMSKCRVKNQSEAESFSFLAAKEGKEPFKVESLSMSECGIDDSQVEVIVNRLKYFTSVRTLNLSNNHLTIEAVESFIQLKDQLPENLTISLFSNRDPKGKPLDRNKVNEMIRDFQNLRISC